MRRHEAAAAVAAIVDGRLKTDGEAVPPALYPRGWLARVELLGELGPDVVSDAHVLRIMQRAGHTQTEARKLLAAMIRAGSIERVKRGRVRVVRGSENEEGRARCSNRSS